MSETGHKVNNLTFWRQKLDLRYQGWVVEFSEFLAASDI